MPEYICNTSPLQFLHQLGRLEILPALVTRLIVPSAVVAELESDLDALHFRVAPVTRAAVLKLAGESRSST